MNFEVTVEVVVGRDGYSDSDIDATLATVMDALVDLGAEDPFIGGSAASRRFEITLVVDAETEDAAFARGRAVILDAIRRAGISIAAPDQRQPVSEPVFSWSSTSVRPAAVA